MLDASGALVYELYVAPPRTLMFWSPPGGLRGEAINVSLGTGVGETQTDDSWVPVDVTAQANNQVVVKVFGSKRLVLTGLSGATTGNQRTLRAGIIGYLGQSGDAVAVVHRDVSAEAGGTGDCTAPTTVAGQNGFDSATYTPGCSSVSMDAANTVKASVDFPTKGLSDDKAYAVKDFGGAAGLAGAVSVHDELSTDSSGTIGTVPVLQVADVAGALVWEVYADRNNAICLWSPAGGLRATSINQCTTGHVLSWPQTTAVDVIAQANGRLTVSINGAQAINLTGLTGATTGNQRTLRAGILGYGGDGATTYPLEVLHANVSAAAGP
jgi:hypothetical protein